MPFRREPAGVRHQFTEPFVLDRTAAREAFGLSPAPLGEGLAATVARRRGQSRAAA